VRKVIVCGSRVEAWEKAGWAAAVLAVTELDAGCIISGGATGVDAGAARMCEQRGVPHMQFQAAWTAFQRKAGPIRNEWMLRWGLPQAVVAVQTPVMGPGTKSMIRLAMREQIPVWLYVPNTTELKRYDMDQKKLWP